MRLSNRLLLASALLAVPATARADGFWTVSNVCGGDNFETCMSATVTWVTATKVVVVEATNLGTFGEVWKTLMLAGLPDDLGSFTVGYSGPVGTSYTDSCNDTVTPPPNCGGPSPDTQYGSEAAPPPSSTGLGNGQTGTWTFTFQNSFTDSELNDAFVAVHGISGPEGCSTWLWTDSEGNPSATGPYDPACTPIPEPGSMILLATGLVGLAGAGLIRRRRKT